MAQYYDFAGQKIILPGAYTDRAFPADQGQGAVTGRVVIMGEATNGGIPYNAYTDIEDCLNVIDGGQPQALSVYGGGTIYYGTEFFLTPTKDARFNTPSEAVGICVNQMTQATTNLLASATPIITLSANKYGTDGNQFAAKVSSGTTTGKLINMTYKGTDVLKQDDTQLNLMAIQYVGAAGACTMTITATKLTTTCAVPGDVLDITLADYTEMGGLINFINNHASYTCTLTGASDEFTNVFDAVTTQDIKISIYNCVGSVEALIRAINATGSVTASMYAGSPRTPITNMSTYQYFTGGTVSSASTSDWTAALLKLEDYDVNNIVAVSGNPTIHLLVQDHVERMNAVKTKKYRQAGFGTGYSAKSDIIAEMKALNSAYIENCVSKFKRFDYINNEVPTADFGAMYLYPMIAGFRYANNVGMDIVFKNLNVLSTPKLSKKDQEDYAAAGGTFIQKTVNVNNATNFEIVCNNTTYQGSQITRTNPACVYAINVLTAHYENSVKDKIAGLDTVADSVIIATIQNWITSYLFPKYRDDYKWITNGPNGQLAFDNVVFAQVGDQFTTTATLTMSVTPRYAFNFLTFIVPGQKV